MKKQMTIIALLLALGSFTVAGQSSNGHNGNNGKGNIMNNGNSNNGKIGKGQFKEKAQTMSNKASDTYSITPEQKAAIEEQAEIMLEGIGQANSREEKQQLRQNYQMAMDNILTEEQKAVRKQKKEQLKAERKKFGIK